MTTLFTNGFKMKERVSPTLTSATLTNKLYNAAGVFQSTSNVGSCIYQSGNESILYSGSSYKSGRRMSNRCHHNVTQFRYQGAINGTEQLVRKADNWYYLYQTPQYNACQAKDTVLGTVKGLSSFPNYRASVGDELACINQAFSNIRPDLTGLSVPNFLLELDDIKTLWGSVKKNLSLFNRIRKEQVAAYRRYLITKKVPMQVIENDLALKFGLKPLIGDIKDLIKTVATIRDKLKRFEDMCGTLIKGDNTVFNKSAGGNGSFAYPAGSTIFYSWSCVQKVKGYVCYSPLFPAVWNGYDAVFRAYLDGLGFELNPRILWDAIPFTFVIDWFFGVGNWLDRFKIDALELPIDLLDCSVQIKTELKVDWYWQRGGSDGLYNNNPSSAGCTYYERVFDRVPIFPDYATLRGLGWKMPKLGQFSLGADLAAVLAGGGKIPYRGD